jgi:hypothetical protein
MSRLILADTGPLVADSAVWTLDSDFRIYRRSGRQSIRLLIPD